MHNVRDKVLQDSSSSNEKVSNSAKTAQPSLQKIDTKLEIINLTFRHTSASTCYLIANLICQRFRVSILYVKIGESFTTDSHKSAISIYKLCINSALYFSFLARFYFWANVHQNVGE